MDNQMRIAQLKESEYQGLFGVHKPTFDAMLTILRCAYEEMHRQGGRPSRLSILDKLVVTLGYYHDIVPCGTSLLTTMSQKVALVMR